MLLVTVEYALMHTMLKSKRENIKKNIVKRLSKSQSKKEQEPLLYSLVCYRG